MSIPAHVRFLKEVIFDGDDLDICLGKHPKRDIWYIQPKTLYNAYESWALDHHLFEKGKFKGIYFKKALIEFNSITWDRSVRQGNKSTKNVVFDRGVLQQEQ